MANQRFVFRDGDKRLELENIAAALGFGLPPVALTSAPKGWRRDGANIQWVGYDPRPFTLQFDISEISFEKAAEQRRQVMKFFADKGARTLECTRYDGLVLSLSPVYIAAPTEHIMYEEPYLPETLQFVAENPYFQRRIPFSSVVLETARLRWPESGLAWPENGIVFSLAETAVTIENGGDVPADTIIRLSGPAVTPYVENITTGQKIEVSRTLAASDVLEINSATGRVDILSESGRMNAFNFLSEDSKLIQLQTGKNVLEYGSAGGGGEIVVGGTEYYASL